jgi:tetratricopeptide (TPR) repeat protein
MAEAQKHYRELVEADKKIGEPSVRVAADLYANGTLCVELDQLAEAKENFQQALRLVREQPVSNGEVLMSMGGVLALQGQFSDAESDYKSAVSILAKHAGNNDLRTARAWNGLGWLYTARGSMDAAGEALRKANSIADKVLPADSTQRIPFLDYHAEYLSQIGRYAEAERVWQKALAIADESLKQQQPQYDVVLLHMGHMYEEIGQFKSAQEAMERFLSIEQHSMPEGSLSQAVGLGELGNIYAHLKDHTEAEPTLMRSIDMLQTMQGNVPLANALIGTYLGDYYMSQQRWTDAAEQYKRVLTTREQLIPGSALVANSMNRLSGALMKLKRKAEAKRYQKAAEAILSEQHNPIYRGDTVDVKSFQAR